MKYKLYCIISKEAVKKISGIRGKMMTQAGHAYLHSFWDSEKRFPQYAKAYQNSDHAYKITLVVDTDEELLTLQNDYKNICGVSLVTDAGFTVFKEPTTTCLGIGPIPEDLIKENLKSLKTFT